jgi:hypothetical protein
MNDRAASVMEARPTEGGPSLMVSEPSGRSARRRAPGPGRTKLLCSAERNHSGDEGHASSSFLPCLPTLARSRFSDARSCQSAPTCDRGVRLSSAMHESAEAERFWADLRERFARFNLELNDDKTRLIEFGRFAAPNREARGLRKPETFDFLGFTHICAKDRGGRFKLKRVTSKTRMRTKLSAVKAELRQRMHRPVPEQGRMARPGRARTPRLLRRARQQPSAPRLPKRGHAPLAARAPAP